MKWRTPICAVFLAACIFEPSFAFTQESAPQDKLSISFPEKNWTIEINSPGFVIESQDRKADGREYLMAKNPQTGVVISVTLERSKDGADSKTCPGYLHKRVDSMSQLNPSGVKYSKIEHMAVVEYFLATFQAMPIRQKNFVACTANEDVYADIHLSKSSSEPADEALFIDVLNHVRVADRVTTNTAKQSQGSLSSPDGLPASPSPGAPGASSKDYFGEGSRHFLARDYRGAIAPYESALDLEKKTSRLSSDEWRVLVDNLAMAYGISGDLNSSEKNLRLRTPERSHLPRFLLRYGLRLG